ncbi:hypothetical protein SDC9_13754 [bioreactor metagenome]|uniref:Uncharacterized protein n=1 Tax=bioreactor metagenome TaxID=1076179 RepID=A0A644TQS9_9ZZZZ
MVFDKTDFVFDFIETEEAVIDGIVNLVNCVINLVETSWQITNSIFNTPNFILNLVKSEDVIS